MPGCLKTLIFQHQKHRYQTVPGNAFDTKHVSNVRPVFQSEDKTVARHTLNPYKPSVPFLGHRQTVQTQIRRRRTRRLIRCLHCLLTGISIRNKIKMKKYTRYQNWKWTRPFDKDGKSIRQMWVKVRNIKTPAKPSCKKA